MFDSASEVPELPLSNETFQIMLREYVLDSDDDGERVTREEKRCSSKVQSANADSGTAASSSATVPLQAHKPSPSSSELAATLRLSLSHTNQSTPYNDSHSSRRSMRSSAAAGSPELKAWQNLDSDASEADEELNAPTTPESPTIVLTDAARVRLRDEVERFEFVIFALCQSVAHNSFRFLVFNFVLIFQCFSNARSTTNSTQAANAMPKSSAAGSTVLVIADAQRASSAAAGAPQQSGRVTHNWKARHSAESSSVDESAGEDLHYIYTSTGRRVLLINGAKQLARSKASQAAAAVPAPRIPAPVVNFPVPADESRHSSAAARHSSTASAAPHRIWLARRQANQRDQTPLAQVILFFSLFVKF